MDCNYSGFFGFPAFDLTNGLNEPAVFNPHAQELYMDDFNLNFSNPQWYPSGDIFSLVHSPPPQFSFDLNLPLLPPPTTTPEPSTTPPSSDLPLAGQSVTQPPADARPPPLPTSQSQVPQPAPEEIRNFNFCPFTEDGKICGEVNWKCSANKSIERHMKEKHFIAGLNSKVWKCPNPECSAKGRSFKRKDALLNHRNKSCNKKQLERDPDFTPLPDIEEGSDEEIKRWMRAAGDQRKDIRQKLRAGILWSVDLLTPVHL